MQAKKEPPRFDEGEEARLTRGPVVKLDKSLNCLESTTIARGMQAQKKKNAQIHLAGEMASPSFVRILITSCWVRDLSSRPLAARGDPPPLPPARD